MSRVFDRASSQALQNVVGIGTSYPFSFSCWIKTDNLTDTLGIVSNADDNGRRHHAIRVTGGYPDIKTYDNTTTTVATATAQITANTWHHICGTFTADSRKIWLDDGNSAEDTRSGAVVIGGDDFLIGVANYAYSDSYFDGMIAEVGVWDKVLDSDDITALAGGEFPDRVSRANLTHYFPLRIDLRDRIGSFDIINHNNILASSDNPFVARSSYRDIGAVQLGGIDIGAIQKVLSTSENITENPTVITRSKTIYDSTVVLVNNITETPTVITRSKTIYTPTVYTGENITETPTVITRSKTIYTPIILTEQNITVLTTVITRSKTIYNSTISTEQNITETPTVITRLKTIYTPIILTEQNITETPTVITRLKTIYDSTVVLVNNITETPTVITRSKTIYNPVVSAGGDISITPTVITRSKTIYNPVVSSYFTFLSNVINRSKTVYDIELVINFAVDIDVLTREKNIYTPITLSNFSYNPEVITSSKTIYDVSTSQGVSLTPLVLLRNKIVYEPIILSEQNILLSTLVISRAKTMYDFIVYVNEIEYTNVRIIFNSKAPYIITNPKNPYILINTN